MKRYKVQIDVDKSIGLNFVMAKIPKMYDNIRVISGSEEEIFKEKYVSGLLENNRLVKLKASALEYT